MERRLTAILAADVVGYSRLMSSDEAGTIAALRSLRKELADPAITAHNGRVFKLTGDGMLVEFPSVVSAVACAVEELTAIATIDLRVDYLRAAEPDLELYARSDCYRLTRNVAFVRAVAWERTASDPFASALGTFMLGANRSDSSFERLVRSKQGGGR